MGIFIVIWLLSMSVWDVKNRGVPVWLLGSGGIVVSAAAFVRWSAKDDWIGLCLGLIPGVVILLLTVITQMVGLGDGIALLSLGMYAGGGTGFAALALGLFAASVYAVILLHTRRGSGQTRMPFLPFLTLGWLIVWGLW